MGRKKDELGHRCTMRVSPPRSLSGARLELWHREFDRFPLGYFVPADMSAMLLYLRWIEIHD